MPGKRGEKVLLYQLTTKVPEEECSLVSEKLLKVARHIAQGSGNVVCAFSAWWVLD
jgi:hypothetical protein